MITFDKIDDILKELALVQDNEKDQRDQARECKVFTTKKNGQWEDNVWEDLGDQGRPRYTYDRTGPILDAIVGELESNEFAATVTPAGGVSTKEKASMFDGLVRSIQNWSDAKFIYKKIARNLTSEGFDCARVISDFRDDDSFDQDLIIKYIPNAIDRVWFDPGSEEQDRSDANWGIILQGLTKEQYDERWPKGAGKSVDSDRGLDYYTNGKRELIIVGEILYKKRTEKTIVQMNNGKVYDLADVESLLEGLEAEGITEVKRRKRPDITVHSRFFDGSDFLEEENETVFSILPIVPFYHCFEIVEDKITWRRIVEKMMDPQRVFNYSISRQVEEGALAPRGKIMMTSEQGEGHESQLANLNTSADPVLFYNSDKEAPPPYQIVGPQVNPALQSTAAEASANIEAVGGMFAENLSQARGVQSGIAIELLQNKGDTGNSGFYVDIAKGITYLCKVLLDGAPKVYDTKRDVALLSADGTTEVKTINDTIIGADGKPVLINDLSGVFDVTCSMGPMFKNKMDQANQALLDVAALMPGVLEGSADIYLRNIDAPGMGKVAERVRAKLLAAGEIPEDQMTEEEKAEIAAQQQAAANQPADPVNEQMMLTMRAQQEEAAAKASQAAAKTQSDQIASQAKLLSEINKGREQDRKDAIAASEANDKHLNMMADTLNKIREAMGVESIVGPSNTNAYIEQAEQLEEDIDKL